MNLLNIQQTGGFPLETDTIDFLQSAHLLMQSFGEMAGDLTILQGCNVTGSNVSAGVVYINGEVLEFKAGTLSNHVIIREEREQRVFEDGNNKDVFIRRYATFGAGATQYPWADFDRINPLRVLQKATVPVGMISMWAGNLAEIPPGWALCDGQNGTPDLRNRFVRGADGGPGATGGQDEVQLTKQNMPPHSHTGSTNTAGSHSHTYQKAVSGRGYDTAADDYPLSSLVNENTSTAGSHSHSLNINSEGGLNGQAVPFDNRPAFYELAFIQFKG